MKIGVISSYAFIKNNNNYGALLQYYALQTYLKKLGYDSYWIRTVLQRNDLRFFLQKLKNYKSLKLFFYWMNAHNGFLSFCDKYLNTSDREYEGFETINNNPPEADAYITGSDQVWGSAALKENYLLFTPEGKKRIAYAASFGKDSIPEEMEKTITPWVKTFDAISVREASGVDICNKMGVEAIHLLDPTLLLKAENYPSATKSRFKKPYIYCYFLNLKSKEDVYFDSIVDFAKNKNLDLHVCAVQGAEKLFNDKYLTAPTPKEWLTDYRYAEYIITNTFHGTVFSLTNHKPFVTLLQNGHSLKQNNRMTSLLQIFHLESRICIDMSQLKSLMGTAIDWDKFEEIRNRYVENSFSFFHNNLQ